MSKNAEDIDSHILFILKKLKVEFEVVKRQGFPSRKRDYYSQYSRLRDSVISMQRWHSWLNELEIDDVQGEAILKIIENEGLLEKFEFVPDYV